MGAPSADLATALATLRSRWGAAAPAYAGEVVGALATVPLEAEMDAGHAGARHARPGALPTELPGRQPDPDRVYSTGFAELDAILGPGGVPRGMGVALRGDLSSGRTTLALRLAAEAQAGGAIVAWLDLASALDPVEAVGRGIRPEWLVVLTPADPEEGLTIAGSLLSGRAVDLLVIDLPDRPIAGPSGTGARFADRLGRLAALARRAGITLVVLEPPPRARSRRSDAGAGSVSSSGRSGLEAAVGEATGIRLELARQSWIRLGRDVVGQRTQVLVARNRAGPPGRRASLRILYADGGERDACLRRDDLLVARGALERQADGRPNPVLAPVIPVPGKRNDATPPSPSPTSPPRSREATPALRLVAGGSGGPRREAVVERERARRGSRGEGPRRPARDAARVGPPAGAGGDVPRRPTRG